MSDPNAPMHLLQARLPGLVTRKLRSLLRMVRSGEGTAGIWKAVKRNLLRAYLHARGGPFAYRTVLGFDFVCIPGCFNSADTFRTRAQLELAECRICSDWLQRGDACLDVGASIGLFSALFASVVGAEGCVVAVEPGPEALACLHIAGRILHLEALRIEPAAVADSAGSVALYVGVGEGLDDLSSLGRGPEHDEVFQAITVPSVTLNDLLTRHALLGRLALVKIDIEGAEPLALRAGSALFDATALPLFLFEVHKGQLAKLGFVPGDVLRFFPTSLFELYHAQHSRSDLTPRFEFGRLYPLEEPAGHDWPWLSNVLAVPRAGKFASRRQRIAALLDGVAQVP